MTRRDWWGGILVVTTALLINGFSDFITAYAIYGRLILPYGR